MERVGFQRVARIFSGHLLQRARPSHVDAQRHKQHENCGDARLDMHAVEEKPVKRFINNVESGDEEKCRFNECGEIFELAVAVGMAFVGRLIRDTHGKECNDGREQVQAGVQRLGEHT